MIPQKALKPIISKGGKDYTQTAVEIALAYKIFSFTGKDYTQKYSEAEKIVATRNQWVSPSNLPEYYDGIDSHLNMGKDTEGILAIRRQLKEFYGLSSAGTEGYVDTRTVTPEVSPPAPVTKKANHPKLRSHLRRASNYQGADQTRYAPATRYILDFESDIDKAIYHTKKVIGSPTTAFKEGIRNWLSAITGLDYDNDDNRNEINNYRQKILDYIRNGLKTNSIKKTTKSGSDSITLFVPTIYDGPFTHIDKTEDQIKDEHNKEVEEIKKLFNKNIKHPKLYEEIGTINTMYPDGGRFERINFRSDIDKAIYFSIKASKSNDEKKQQVREWLFQVTGLQKSDPELTKYREKIINVIRIVFKYELDKNYITEDSYATEIPIVYDGYFQDPEEDDEDDEEYDDEKEDNEEYDDLYGSNLDDLLDSIKEEDSSEDPEEIAEQIEKKKQELEDAAEEEDFGSEDDIPDELLRDPIEDESDIGSEDDIPDELLQDEVDPEVLERIINKRKGKTGTKGRKSYYVSNTKLLQGITQSLAAVTGQLQQVNQSLLEQNELIQTNIDLNLASLEALQAQDDILTTKFDAILNAFQQQYEASKKAEEDVKRLKAEQKLEGQVSSAGTEDPEDLTKGGKGGDRINRINQYYRSKLVRQLYRRLPRQLRSLRTKGRKIQKMPGKAVGRIKNATASGISKMLPSKVSNFGKNIVAARSASQNMGGLSKLKGVGRNVPGLKQALAVWEYGDRKAAGQTNTQAMIGVGGGLAGAAAGAAIGTMLFPGVGTLAGLLIGAAFSAAGGYAGSKIADTVTGAEDKQYELGTPSAKPGTAMLHGTELLIDKDKENNISLLDSTGATLVAATSKFINSLGPAGATVAPLFEQKAAPLIKLFGLPATTAQTNVGGGFASIGSVFKKSEKKKEKSKKKSLGVEFDDLLKGDSESFAEKLLKILDPKNIFANILSLINNTTDAPEFNGDSLMAEGGEAVSSTDITSAFGWRWGRQHAGIDIASGKFKQGTPISVIKPGKVVFAGWQDPNNHKRGWGQFVAIEHDDGTASLYGHLDQINVSQGQRIEPDSAGKFPVIGKLGNTGSSTGAHLHFEVGTGWTGGSLKGHMNPAPVVGQYLRGGGNVKKKETPGQGDAPTVKPPEAASSNVVDPSGKTSPVSQIFSRTTPQQVSSTPKVGEQLAAQTNDNMDGMVAATYGAGVPKTPRWMQEIERQYNEVKDKPYNPGTPKPGRGMGDTWMPQASVDHGSEIASLSRSQQESGSNVVLINNQSSPMPSISSPGRTEIIQLGEDNSSETLRNLMLQRLA